MQKQKTLNGFTLVELIIVITILGILSTIAFVSFQSYSKNARDSNRLETMSIVQKGISLNQVTTSKTLMPDDYTTVSASGNILGYEGIVGDGVSRGIQMSSIPKDPIRGENYIYYTNKDRNKVQVMGFLEGEDLAYIGIERANAAGSGSKLPKVSGDRLGILLDVNNNRVTGTGVDILLTNSGTSYTTYFSNSDTLTSSGKDLYSKVYNRREDLLKDTTLASLDDSLVGYWDMETTTLSGGLTVLKDLSKNGTNFTISGTINIGGEKGKINKGTVFNGINQSLYTKSNSSFSGITQITISSWFYLNSYQNSELKPLEIIQKWRGFTFGISNSNYFWFELSSGTGADITSYTTTFKPDLNKWYHVVGTYNGDKVKVYVDGKLYSQIGAGAKNATIFNSNTDYIGIAQAGWENNNQSLEKRLFNGIIDEIRIYNRSLSDNEILQLYGFNK